jgi:hypothetical protein
LIRRAVDRRPAPGWAGTVGRGDVAVVRCHDCLRLKYFRCSG